MRRAPGARSIVVPDRGELGQERAQLRSAGTAQEGAAAATSSFAASCIALHDLEHHERHREAAGLRHEAQDALPGLQLALAQEVGQHDEDRRRAGIAARREVAVPAFARNRQAGARHQVFDHAGELLRRVVAQEVVDLLGLEHARHG